MLPVDTAYTLRADRVEALARLTAHHDCALVTAQMIVEQSDATMADGHLVADYDLGVSHDADLDVYETFNAPERKRPPPGAVDYRECTLACMELNGYWLCKNQTDAKRLAASFGDFAAPEQRGGQWVVIIDAD